MTSATDELCRMLDERGMEYEVDEHGWVFFDVDGFGWIYVPSDTHGQLIHQRLFITPEQAIAATLGNEGVARSNDGVAELGAGTCRNISKVMDEHGQARFVCSECDAWIDSRMLWNPEYRDGESPWVSGCKLNYCPNCGAKVIEPTTNNVDAEVDDG